MVLACIELAKNVCGATRVCVGGAKILLEARSLATIRAKREMKMRTVFPRDAPVYVRNLKVLKKSFLLLFPVHQEVLLIDIDLAFNDSNNYFFVGKAGVKYSIFCIECLSTYALSRCIQPSFYPPPWYFFSGLLPPWT